jgi:energy-coupling factor transporter ATP-binding protein EcfA2
MAQIREFTIEGLAGRTEPYSLVLNPDVNVFFGLNGSGKTTLLKILYSALSTETEVLSDLPFTRAAVRVFLNKHRREFVRTFVRREQAINEETNLVVSGPQASLWDSDQEFLANSTPLRSVRYMFDRDVGAVVEGPKWASDPPEPDGPRLTTYRAGFLPISRLYRNVLTSSGKRLSDRELDGAFARGLQAQWSEYYADISKETAKAQERGLANILGFFLTGGQSPGDAKEAPDEKEAFKRISGFLDRQPGFGHLLRSEAEFAAIYAKKKELQNVVKQIEQVETAIAEITAPRERFRSVLESMFTGSKHLEFTDKEIKVQISSNREIGLSLLSSGEKQLLFVALHALIGGNNCLIVDEPELSMHVEWQRKLVATLRELNPRLQLIMATHSPEIMADLPDNQIFRIWPG